MNIVLLNGSPKKKASASRFFSNILRFMLFVLRGCAVTEYALRHKNYDTVFAGLSGADAVVITAPLYVDGIPSHVLGFLREAEQFCKKTPCCFKVYVISNSGFVAGRNNETQLLQYQCWCERSGVPYGGGLGIGGGVMLRVVFFMGLFLGIGGFILQIILNLASGAAFLFDKAFAALGYRMGIWLFFSFGMLACEWRLATAIKKRASVKNRYTRVMVPSFIFLLFADVFMLVAALGNGTSVFSLFKREQPPAGGGGTKASCEARQSGR